MKFDSWRTTGDPAPLAGATLAADVASPAPRDGDFVFGTLGVNPLERIAGPLSGYWLATIACPVGPEYVGGARIFALRPRSYWDGGAVVEVLCTETAGFAEDAHAAAVELASRELRRLG